jgi:F0F1-type ATP synthase assembly protein I
VKKEFIKEHGKMVEKFILDNEAKWVYIQYSRGNVEKSSYFLKSGADSLNEHIEKVFNDYNVSDIMQEEIRKHLSQETRSMESHFQEFLNFLITTLSLHLMIGAALAMAIYGGYTLGEKLDILANTAPAFTVIGVLFGFAIGGLIGYIMIYNYFGREKPLEKAVVVPKKKKRSETAEWPRIEVTMKEIHEAIRCFAKDLPNGINRTILIKDDFSIDFEQLAPYIGGVPTKNFYMSKETYEIFEENEKGLPAIVDKVQKAVNLYFKVNNRYPIKPYDSLHRVNYYQLIQGHYLDEKPDIDLYFTDLDGLITHMKPNRKQIGG